MQCLGIYMLEQSDHTQVTQSEFILHNRTHIQK